MEKSKIKLDWRKRNSLDIPYSRITAKNVLNKKCKKCHSTMRAKKDCLCCGSPCDCTLFFKCNNRKCGEEYIDDVGNWDWAPSKIKESWRDI